MKSVFRILCGACALFVGLLQAQQPPVQDQLSPAAPGVFQFNKPVPSARLQATVAAAKKLIAAREAVLTALPENREAAQAKLASVEEEMGKMSIPLLIDVAFFIDHPQAREWQEIALRTGNFDLLALALADSPAPVNERLFAELASQAVINHGRSIVDARYLTMVEQLLMRAHNISQNTRNTLLSHAANHTQTDLIPLLMYGGIITIDDKKYPIEGGARCELLVGQWPVDSLHKIIATNNVDSKSQAELDYLQRRVLPLDRRAEWWEELEANTLKAVKEVIEKGADVNLVELGLTPLNVAVLYGTPAIVELLLDRGADVDAADEEGATPLHDAAFGGNADTVRLLLDRGADVDAADEEGETPLRIAALEGNTDTVRLLLDRGADINVQNNEGVTPLHHASLGGHAKI